jgi:hypothetical protein
LVGVRVVFRWHEELEEPLELIEDDEVWPKPLDRRQCERIAPHADQFLGLLLEQLPHSTRECRPVR